MALSEHDYMAFKMNRLEMSRPHINEESFSRAIEEVREASGETDTYPVLVVAAAIHEFSNMINEHIAEAYRCFLEREDK